MIETVEPRPEFNEVDAEFCRKHKGDVRDLDNL